MKQNLKKILTQLLIVDSGKTPLETLLKKLSIKGYSLVVNQLPLKAFIVALKQTENNKPLSIVLDLKGKDLGTITEDLSTLLGDQLFLFPPYQSEYTPVPGFISKSREEFDRSYKKLSTETPGVYVVHPECLNYKIRKETSQKTWLSVEIGKEVDPSGIIKKLLGWGYESVDRCVASNMVSLRGGILDIFPTHSNRPIRIEFFSNTVESIRIFDIDTQLSVGNREKIQIQKPPTLDTKSDSSQLKDMIKSKTTNLLYINTSSITVGPVKKNSEELFSESLNLNKLSLDVFNRRVLDVYNNVPVLILFNVKNKVLPELEKTARFDGGFSGGFSVPSLGLACTPFPGSRKRQQNIRALTKNKKQKAISTLSEIKWGDFLVHQDFGIGVYKGLNLVGNKENQEENIKIEYANGGVVFVPVGRFDRVHKYLGVGESTPKVSTLGTVSWEKQKQVAKQSANEVVEHLVSIHLARSTPRGFLYTKENVLIDQLEDSFPHQETEDQEKAISDIFVDMNKSTPMDRLIYGDVGFGKTEVAIRAAMRAVISGKTVFFLTPTTILSDQHYITCLNRMGGLGVEVELLSRFKSKKEQALIIERLYKNKIDVLIGTHRILSEDVPKENLGLLIVDEEHRFGVKHKETIRKLKRRVDVLTLTATPIPRTLQQSLVGIRDTSKIETPPRERLPIETFVQRFNWVLVEKTIKKEVLRGGQTYFLHNDIEQIPFYLEKLQSLFPKQNIGVAHGQMKSRELEKTILSFFDGTIDVLICTTIIESGLDVQNANTIIINNAQNLGLAQLYQIRGRVGRSNLQAFCFLCIPKNLKLMPNAFQRLRAIEHHTALGSGYGVAMKDLEIRGAGNLFGYKQSGQISRIGFELYNKILTKALQEKQGEKQEKQKEKLSVVFSGSAFIDHDYMPTVQERLLFYQKISNSMTLSELLLVRDEIKDRFGLFSENLKNLFSLAEIQLSLYKYPISKCKISTSVVVLYLDSIPNNTSPEVFLKDFKDKTKELGLDFKFVPTRGSSVQLVFTISGLREALFFAHNFNDLFLDVLSK